jgi:hypothetical protein
MKDGQSQLKEIIDNEPIRENMITINIESI